MRLMCHPYIVIETLLLIAVCRSMSVTFRDFVPLAYGHVSILYGL